MKEKISVHQICKITTPISLLFAVLCEILFLLIANTDKTEFLKETLRFSRNIFFVLLMLSLSVLLFMFIKSHLGTFRAVFITIIIFSFLSLTVGGIMMLLAVNPMLLLPNASHFETLYIYIVGLLIAIFSCIIIVLTILSYIIAKVIISYNKKHNFKD